MLMQAQAAQQAAQISQEQVIQYFSIMEL